MDRQDFWSQVFKLQGSVTPCVLGRVAFFTLFSTAVWVVYQYVEFHSGIAVAPYEILGVILALLLVLRTNSGYDRWYEGRKLWGGIVNQSRNLGMIGVVYGPQDHNWQNQFARWTAAFSHACRHSLRDDSNTQDMHDLIGQAEAEKLGNSQHMPMYVAGRLANMLRSAVASGGMDRFAFIQAEKERATLIDHIGACERIKRTPLAEVFSIKIRRFLFIYLTVLPIAIVDKMDVLTPLVTLLVAFSFLSLDQIGIELQSPFSPNRLSHLPLNSIASNIEENILGFLDQASDETTPRKSARPERHEQHATTPPERGFSVMDAEMHHAAISMPGSNS